MLRVSEQEHYNQERDTNRGFIDWHSVYVFLIYLHFHDQSFQWKCFCEVRDSPRWTHCIKYWCRAPPLKIEGCLMWAWPLFFAACAAQANFLAAHFKIMYGIRSLAKQIQSSAFDKSLHCHEMLVQMQIPRVLCLRLSCCLFLSSKNVFRCYLMIFKCALAIRLHSLTVELNLLCVQHRWRCELETISIWPFLEYIFVKLASFM